ncbi:MULTISPECIES: DUF4034 domain-containing protein [unclassified Dyella]|uniref:DUF4034 domain-containing protein n=1 Tax=unclassified Dyella TaxID=2634549 RepID=UPI000C860AFA|nr:MULTISPECIES: DUF4034 domain-containing protein [unclassified Dyella]MDR3444317.1 DUF4034 domain-containing protein [Dyella sp.]PMQ03948.1 hypothetical protein DyAD56_17015 [Dyella sp. AD56]
MDRLLRLCIAVAVGCLSVSASLADSPNAGVDAKLQGVLPIVSSDDSRHAFTPDEMKSFLIARAKAEKISDRLQRCLDYPDPPGSRWTHESVAAYCRFRLQPVINRVEMKALLDGGHAADIDRRLTEWEHQPKTHPEAFWRMISEDFVRSDADARQLLEAWKQQSPTSAFAYAASSYGFLQEAWEARGGDYIQETPRAKINAMETLLARAEGDLRHAIKLDPSVALPYAVMIESGIMLGDDASVADAAKHGMLASLPSLPVYEALALAAQPRWGGSLTTQSNLLASVQTNAAKNPLLVVVRAKILSEQLGLGCYCSSRQEDSVYRTALDQTASRTELFDAGESALNDGQYKVAVIYLSEASRFDYPGVEEKLSVAMAHLDPTLQKSH